MKGETYEEFVAKFGVAKTTDDCYTPPEVYGAVLEWALESMPKLRGLEVLRPFKPGGDYERDGCPEGCCVIDNPPFSILAQIVDRYLFIGAPFVLFAPALTMAGLALRGWRYGRVTAVVAGAEITYENGAKVRTGFLTDAWEGSPPVVVAGTLGARLKEASKRGRNPKVRRRLTHPRNYFTGATLMKYAAAGVDMVLGMGDVAPDPWRDSFGGGMLVSTAVAERLEREKLEREKLEREKLEREKLERERLEYTPLTPAERMTVAALDGDKKMN